MCEQITIVLKGRQQGSYLITGEILKKLDEKIDKFRTGICHIFLQHTSASLSVNENADPYVREDLQSILTEIIPKTKKFDHDGEGSDDMPAHALSVLCGVSLTIPINDGQLMLGSWQGIYLNEHRKFGGDRKVVVTLMGSVQ